MNCQFTTVAIAVAAMALATSAGAAPAQHTFFDQEPNDTKATAQLADDIVHGDVIGLGNNQGAFDPDVFRVQTAALPAGIYRHTLRQGFADVPPRMRILGLDAVLDQVLPNSISILSDSTDFDPANPMVAWYGFGQAEELYVELMDIGSNRSAPPTEIVFETQAVTPIDLGTLSSPAFPSSAFSIEATGVGGTLDTEIFVYDADFQLVRHGWSDDAFFPNSPAAVFTQLLPGTYYAAVADKGLAGDTPVTRPFANEFASPVGVTDFRGALVVAGLAPTVDLFVSVIGPGGGNSVSAIVSKPEPLEAAWVRFTVGTGQSTSTFCAGDGSIAACPCANDAPTGSRAGCLHSGVRGGSMLRSFGYFTEEPVVLTLFELPPNAGALVFVSMGSQSASPSFGGLSCLAGPLTRLPAVFANDIGTAEVQVDLVGQGLFLAGTTVYAQAAFRDPSAAIACQVNLTGGVAFQL